MEPENEPLEEEIPIRNHHVQVPCWFSGGGVYDYSFILFKIARGAIWKKLPKLGVSIDKKLVGFWTKLPYLNQITVPFLES